jgi:hypothetical protein
VRRVTNSVRDNPPLIFTNSVLFLFILFFATERLLWYAVLWSQLHWLTYRLSLIQLLSSMLVAVGAAVVLPHLRSMKEGSAIARNEHDRFLAAAESSLDDFYIFDGVPDSSGKIVDFRFNYTTPTRSGG